MLPARGGPLAPHPPAKRVQPTNRDTPSLVTFRSVIGFELGKETPARQAPAKTYCSRTGSTRTPASSRQNSTSSPGAIPRRSRIDFGITTCPLGPTREVIPVSMTSGEHPRQPQRTECKLRGLNALKRGFEPKVEHHYLHKKQPIVAAPCKFLTKSPARERTTGFEPATLTLARCWNPCIQRCSVRLRGLRPSLRPGSAAKSVPQ